MKKIFILLSICLSVFQTQAQSKYCASVDLVGSNIEISIKETNGTPFFIGVSDIIINPGGLNYTTYSCANSLPCVAINGGQSSLLSPYTIDVLRTQSGNLALSILNNGGSKQIGSTAELLVSIPVTGSGTPTLVNSTIFNNTSPTSSQISEFCTSTVLPIELLSFKADKKEDKALIQWETTKEKNLAFYAVERSIDGKNFKTINYEKPKAKSENETAYYNVVDEKPELGINYYRLKTQDLDGAVSQSKIVSVDFGSQIKAKTFPNPFSHDLSIEIDIEKNIKGNVTIELLDVLGKVIQTKLIVAEGRKVNCTLPTDDLVPGTYLIRMKNGNDTWQQKITKY
ncbi:MAG: T9SS type A sorting domain-containing protein [Saprospiraceae bacterium]|nr:T9SS type A sorting domain-containing protein [Saprospiraceae bacterium]